MKIFAKSSDFYSAQLFPAESTRKKSKKIGSRLVRPYVVFMGLANEQRLYIVMRSERNVDELGNVCRLE